MQSSLSSFVMPLAPVAYPRRCAARWLRVLTRARLVCTIMAEALEHALRQFKSQRQQLIREVAAHRVTERRLLAQAERFRTTLASIGDAVIATNVDTRITFRNSVAEALTGRTAYSRDHWLHAVFRIVHETSRTTDERPVARALQDDAIAALATHAVLIARDGKERPMDGSAARIHRTDEQAVGCVPVFRDIIEHHRFTAERREAQAEGDATLECITDALTQLDRNRRVMRVNAQPERMGLRSGTGGTR